MQQSQQQRRLSNSFLWLVDAGCTKGEQLAKGFPLLPSRIGQIRYGGDTCALEAGPTELEDSFLDIVGHPGKRTVAQDQVKIASTDL